MVRPGWRSPYSPYSPYSLRYLLCLLSLLSSLSLLLTPLTLLTRLRLVGALALEWYLLLITYCLQLTTYYLLLAWLAPWPLNGVMAWAASPNRVTREKKGAPHATSRCRARTGSAARSYSGVPHTW